MELTIKEALELLLDHVDYTVKNCKINDPVGGVLPMCVIKRCKEALDYTSTEPEKVQL